MNEHVKQQDILSILNNYDICWQNINGKTILITGSTGLIGRYLIDAIAMAVELKGLKVKLVLPVRNPAKARKIFGNLKCTVETHITEYTIGCGIKIEEEIDYTIHCACITDTQSMERNPVEVIESIVKGTEEILQLCVEKNSSFVYISSMEIYGSPDVDRPLSESDLCKINLGSIRSCYPESKRLAELMCECYNKEYNINYAIIRLAQTLFPFIHENEEHFPTMILRHLAEGSDIHLKTDGSKKRTYIYYADAISAILFILTSGVTGTYNVANESTYCSIKELAELAIRCSDGKINLFLNEGGNTLQYSTDKFCRLSTTKIESIGWHPKYDLNHWLHQYLIK